MEKLELKHSVPYLPYKLKCLVKDYPIDVGEKPTNDIYTLDALYCDSECVFHDLVESQQGFKDIKPILRPLSDFEKVIAKELMIKFNCSLKIVQEVWKLIQKEIKMEDVSYKTYLMMCENHLDFNGLIEKGLAIDINTLS